MEKELSLGIKEIYELNNYNTINYLNVSGEVYYQSIDGFIVFSIVVGDKEYLLDIDQNVKNRWKFRMSEGYRYFMSQTMTDMYNHFNHKEKNDKH